MEERLYLRDSFAVEVIAALRAAPQTSTGERRELDEPLIPERGICTAFEAMIECHMHTEHRCTVTPSIRGGASLHLKCLQACERDSKKKERKKSIRATAAEARTSRALCSSPIRS